jgi:hypothetical protein
VENYRLVFNFVHQLLLLQEYKTGHYLGSLLSLFVLTFQIIFGQILPKMSLLAQNAINFPCRFENLLLQWSAKEC